MDKVDKDPVWQQKVSGLLIKTKITILFSREIDKQYF